MNNLLPTIRQAPRENIATLQRRDTSRIDEVPIGFQKSLLRKQACVESLGSLRAEPELSEIAQTGWSQLIRQTTEWTDRHIKGLDLSSYARQSGEFEYQTRAEAQRVAGEGVVTIGAFLEVIGRVAMKHEFQGPNEQLTALAKRSQAFILAWSGIHSSVDVRLAYALAKPPKPYALKDTLSPRLRFNPKWLTIDGAGQQIMLAEDRVQNLRDDTDIKHPNSADTSTEPLFGCPGRQWIPRIFNAMAHQAELGGLFALSYLDERRNHGYEVDPPCVGS
jgi:hypothetical protein